MNGDTIGALAVLFLFGGPIAAWIIHRVFSHAEYMAMIRNGMTPPPDLVNPLSGHRSNVFYVGQPVVFQLGGAAQSYEVRDYWGERIDQGPAAERITLKVQKPGWYKLYVEHVQQSHLGADLDFLVGKSGADIPRDSH